MGSVQVVTDSPSQIPVSLRQELGIRVVQLPYAWDGETYLDEVDMGPRQFYSRLRQSRTLPTTSAPTPGSYREAFEEPIAEGKEVLLIHVGKRFSSAHKTAQLAREMLPDAPIHLIDSKANGLGLGFQVLAVARRARQGASLQELIELAARARQQTGVVFAVEDLGYIHRGGRISLGERLLASALRLVPIMEIVNGPIEVVGRSRTSTGTMQALIDRIGMHTAQAGQIRIGVLHADNEEDAFRLRALVEDQLAPDELLFKELSPILGTHTGPGAVGLAFSHGL